MIDERKIKRELSGLIRSTQEGTIEHKIYQTFLAYISRQKVISFMTLRFYGRMERYFQTRVPPLQAGHYLHVLA